VLFVLAPPRGEVFPDIVYACVVVATRLPSGRTVRSVSDYTDPQHYAFELLELFHKLPVIVAHSSQLTRPGDFIRQDRLGLPLILTRANSGEVRAFRNICIHRHATMENERKGSRNSFVCPCHNRTYDFEGKLIRMNPLLTRAPLARPDCVRLRPLKSMD